MERAGLDTGCRALEAYHSFDRQTLRTCRAFKTLIAFIRGAMVSVSIHAAAPKAARCARGPRLNLTTLTVTRQVEMT